MVGGRWNYPGRRRGCKNWWWIARGHKRGRVGESTPAEPSINLEGRR